MWPRLQHSQTPTTRSHHYISLIPSFGRENWKAGVACDTEHSSQQCAALIRPMGSLQRGAFFFSLPLISASTSHLDPSSFSQSVLLSPPFPFLPLNLPSFQFNLKLSLLRSTSAQSVCWYALLRTQPDDLGFSPLGLICFFVFSGASTRLAFL